jgi:hypothetical protein
VYADKEKGLQWLERSAVTNIRQEQATEEIKEGFELPEYSAGSNFPQKQAIQNLITNKANKFNKSSDKEGGAYYRKKKPAYRKGTPVQQTGCDLLSDFSLTIFKTTNSGGLPFLCML